MKRMYSSCTNLSHKITNTHNQQEEEEEEEEEYDVK